MCEKQAHNIGTLPETIRNTQEQQRGLSLERLSVDRLHRDPMRTATRGEQRRSRIRQVCECVEEREEA